MWRRGLGPAGRGGRCVFTHAVPGMSLGKTPGAETSACLSLSLCVCVCVCCRGKDAYTVGYVQRAARCASGWRNSLVCALRLANVGRLCNRRAKMFGFLYSPNAIYPMLSRSWEKEVFPKTRKVPRSSQAEFFSPVKLRKSQKDKKEEVQVLYPFG